MARHPQTPWRRDRAILDRLERVERLHLTGKSNVAIAAEIGVSEKTIRRDLERADTLYRDRVGEGIKENRAIAIRRLEIVIATAMDGYTLDTAREHAALFGESYVDGDGEVHIVARDDKGSAQYKSNKAALLATAEKAMMDIARLQGTVVEKGSVTDADGNDLSALILKARADGSGDR